MELRVRHLTVACRNPDELARFWNATLGGTLIPDNRGFLLEPLPECGTPRILFTASDAAESAGGCLSLHVNSAGSTLKAQVERLTDLGATVVFDQPQGPLGTLGLGTVVMADPEGNRFTIESSDAEREAVSAALDAGQEVDISDSYFVGRPQDPDAFTTGRVSIPE